MGQCYCDYDLPEFFEATKHTARKAHKCDECKRAIQPGTVYEVARGKWDGEFSTYKMCAWCMKLRNWVTAHVPCFCWGYTELHEQAVETVRCYSSAAPGLLFSTYRFIVKARQQPTFTPQPRGGRGDE